MQPAPKRRRRRFTAPGDALRALAMRQRGDVFRVNRWAGGARVTPLDAFQQRSTDVTTTIAEARARVEE